MAWLPAAAQSINVCTLKKRPAFTQVTALFPVMLLGHSISLCLVLKDGVSVVWGSSPVSYPCPMLHLSCTSGGQADAPVIPGGPLQFLSAGAHLLWNPSFLAHFPQGPPCTSGAHCHQTLTSLHPQVPTSLFGWLVEERGRIVGNLAKGGRSSMGFL